MANMQQRYGVLIVVSGPSGCGKTTITKRLISEENVKFSISCTTRNMREGEVDGRDYYFLSKEQFQAKVQAGEFLEWAEVHGNFYGTLKSEVLDYVLAGEDVIMDIDVQGAAQIRAVADEQIKRSYCDVFIAVDRAELSKRLQARATDSQQTIELRLDNAASELGQAGLYEFLFYSGDKEQDYRNMCDIVRAKRMSTRLLK